MTEVRSFTPMPLDVALVSRLAKSQFLMDATTALARGTNPLEAALLAAVPLSDLGLPTLILKHDHQGYLGQIRHRATERLAQIVCLAPVPCDFDDEVHWLTLLEGLVEVAGRRGAQFVRAEVPESEYIAIQLLRRAGFAVNTRQVVYRYVPGNPLYPVPPRQVRLRHATERDTNQILALLGKLVPSLVQQAVPCGEQEQFAGLVVETRGEGRLVGYLDVIEGKVGYIIKPFLHPDIFGQEASQIFAEAIRSLSKSDRLPVYIGVLSFQDWLKTPLEELDLDVSESYAILVKPVVARVRQTDEIVQGARNALLSSLVSAIELGIDQDTTP